MGLFRKLSYFLLSVPAAIVVTLMLPVLCFGGLIAFCLYAEIRTFIKTVDLFVKEGLKQ